MTSLDLRMLTEANVERSIKAVAQVEFTQQVVQQLEKALDTIKNSLFERVLMPGVPAITVRVATLQNVLHGLTVAVPDQAPIFLQNIGKQVGRDFAQSMESYLEDHGFFAAESNVLLKVWSMLDGGAGWGQFEPALASDRVNVSLTGSSLVRGEAADVSATDQFLGGYVLGVVWELFKYRRRRLLETGMQSPGHVVEPTSVEIQHQGHGRASFTLPLCPEELESTYDLIHKIRRLIRGGDRRKIGVEIRSALENGLKAKVNMPTSEDISVRDLTKGYRKEGIDRRVKFSFNALDAIWNKTSPDSHGEVDIPLEEAIAMSAQVEEAVDELELLDLGEKPKQEIQTFARNRRSGRMAPGISVSAGDRAQIQIGIVGRGRIDQSMGADAKTIEMVFEILAAIRERLDTDDPPQAEAEKQINAVLEDRKFSWKELIDKGSAIIRTLAAITAVSELVERLAHLLGL